MNILYLAPIAFDELKQRPQYLAEGLAERHNVFYIEPAVSLLTALHNGGLSSRGCVRKAPGRLTVVRPDGRLSLPYRLKYLDRRHASAYPQACQLKRLAGRIDLIWAGYPGWMDIISHFPEAGVVYDIMDDYSLLTKEPHAGAYIRRAEAELEQRAGRLLTSSLAIRQRLRRKGRHAHLVPNALPDSYRGNFEIPRAQAGGRIFVYAGMIAEWLDRGAVRCIASEGKGRVILVGPESVPRIRAENIRYAGKVPKEQIPAFLKRSTACLYPFLAGRLAETVNPVKIYEYLAFNRPVIARRTRETEQFGDKLHLYSDMEELKGILGQELRPPFREREAYERFLDENTWSARLRQISRCLGI